jgi:hypothetical protein
MVVCFSVISVTSYHLVTEITLSQAAIALAAMLRHYYAVRPMSRDQNAEQNHDVKIENKFFESAEQFIYLGTTLTNQNSIEEEIKSRLKSGNTVLLQQCL